MLDVLLHRFREDNDSIHVNEESFPLEARNNDIQLALEVSWGVVESERHASILELSNVTDEGALLAILSLYVDLLVTVERIERCKGAGTTQNVDIFVHVGKSVRFFGLHRSEPPVVDAEV